MSASPPIENLATLAEAWDNAAPLLPPAAVSAVAGTVNAMIESHHGAITADFVVGMAMACSLVNAIEEADSGPLAPLVTLAHQVTLAPQAKVTMIAGCLAKRILTGEASS